MGQVDVEKLQGGRQDKVPQFFKADHQKWPTQDAAEKGKAGEAESSLVGVASFPLLFLSRHDLLFQMCIDSLEPPSRCHLQCMRHDLSSFDVSEETVVILPSGIVPHMDLRRNLAMECQCLCLPRQQKCLKMCMRQETRKIKTSHEPTLPLAQLCISQSSQSPRTFLENFRSGT